MIAKELTAALLLESEKALADCEERCDAMRAKLTASDKSVADAQAALAISRAAQSAAEKSARDEEAECKALEKQIAEARTMETAALIKAATMEATMRQMDDELKALRAKPVVVPAMAAPRAGKVRAVVRERDPNGAALVVDIDMGTLQ